MLYSQRDRRQHVDGRIGKISCYRARLNGGAPRPLGKVVQPLQTWQLGPQQPQAFHDKAVGKRGIQPDGTRVNSWVGRGEDDPYNVVLHKNLPGVLTNEAGVLGRLAAEQIAREWGTTCTPSGTTPASRSATGGSMSPENSRGSCSKSPCSRSRTIRCSSGQPRPRTCGASSTPFYLCLVAVGGDRSGVLTGLPVTKNMPCTEERGKAEAKHTTKWLCSLLANPDNWPSGGRHAAAHAPRLRQLRSIFLVEPKWTAPRYLIQPVMAARARAFSVLDDTPGEYDDLRQCDV